MRITAKELTARIEAERAAQEALREAEVQADAARWAWLTESESKWMAKLDQWIGCDFRDVPPRKLYRLWVAYSQDTFASFLVVDRTTVAGFLGWLVQGAE